MLKKSTTSNANETTIRSTRRQGAGGGAESGVGE
jgi:hypothetical protein